MILTLAFIALYIFYAGGGFKKLIQAARIEPEPVKAPPPEPQTIPTPEPVKVEPQAPPVNDPRRIYDRLNPPPQTPERIQLENTANNCLTAAGCKFNTFYYCLYKSDIELMDIIKDYNMNK